MATTGQIQLDSLLRDVYEATKKMPVAEARAYFAKAQKQHSAIRAISIEDFAISWLRQDAFEQILNKPAASTAKELWDAVCAWEPDPLYTPQGENAASKIVGLLESEQFEPVPLGRLRGEYMWALEPSVCLAPGANDYRPRPPRQTKRLDYSLSNRFAIAAIKYADGHPSEGDYHLTDEFDKRAAATPGPKRATEDRILRRFMALGFILMKINGAWVKTGHVLVIDASYGRRCHPWIVLAAEWRTNDEEYFERHETEIVQVPKKIRFNDPDALGILPPNNNRTTIAPLIPYGGIKVGNEKFASHFGVNFNFDLERMGRSNRGHRSPRGPDLADIMSWWWDPDNKQEVCYTPAGNLYMTYNPATRQYDRPYSGEVNDEVGNLIEDQPQAVEGHQGRGLTSGPGSSGPSSGRYHGQGYGSGPGHSQRQESSAFSSTG